MINDEYDYKYGIKQSILLSLEGIYIAAAICIQAMHHSLLHENLPVVGTLSLSLVQFFII